MLDVSLIWFIKYFDNLVINQNNIAGKAMINHNVL